MHKMQAMVIDRYGGPDELKQIELPIPEPKRGQVLVRTHYVGVNPKDVIVRKGKFRRVTGTKFPLIVGHDIAGEIVSTFRGSDFHVGDLVFGMINDFAGRAYAQFAAVYADQLAPIPKSIELKFAAAVPLAAQTALQALRDSIALQPGHKILINGASGGVGTFAVQIAKILGAHVTRRMQREKRNTGQRSWCQ